MMTQMLRMHAHNSLLVPAGEAAPAAEIKSYRRGWQQAQEQLDQALRDQLTVSFSRKNTSLQR